MKEIDGMDRYLNANIVFSKFSRDYMELKKLLPIRPSEMGVINIITKREGFYTPCMIADLLGVSKVMITTHISVLEKKGYVYKKPLSNDKRSFYIMPTRKAIVLSYECEEKLNKYLKNIEDKLGSDNFDLLINLMNNANDVLEMERNANNNEVM